MRGAYKLYEQWCSYEEWTVMFNSNMTLISTLLWFPCTDPWLTIWPEKKIRGLLRLYVIFTFYQKIIIQHTHTQIKYALSFLLCFFHFPCSFCPLFKSFNKTGCVDTIKQNLSRFWIPFSKYLFFTPSTSLNYRSTPPQLVSNFLQQTNLSTT